MNFVEKGILYATIGLSVLLLMKLATTGLVKIYRLLFFYLACDLVGTCSLLFIKYHSNFYAIFYMAYQTAKLVVAAFMVAEMYFLALERQPALGRFLRNTVGYILLAAGSIPVIWIFTEKSNATKSPILFAYLTFEQTLNATMAIFLILISCFMAWFPVPLRRNVVIYITGYIVWALSRVASNQLVKSALGNASVAAAANLAESLLILGCLLYWLLGLQKEGESRTTIVGHLWNRAEADRLTEQLNAINNSLARMRRR